MSTMNELLENESLKTDVFKSQNGDGKSARSDLQRMMNTLQQQQLSSRVDSLMK